MSLSFLLKSFEEEDKPKKADEGAISLTGILQRKRLKLSRAKGLRKASDYFNPYAIAYGFCMREKVAQLCGWYTIWVKPPTPKEQLRFDVGNKYHDILQGYLWKCGILEGWWRCHECNADFWARAPEGCLQCGQTYRKHLEFREVPLTSEEYHINGRSDGIIWVEVDKDIEEKHIMDIKSIRNKGIAEGQSPALSFEDLEDRGPSELNVVQLNLYMMMSGIHDGHLLYVSTNSQRLKSFHVKHNRALLQPYLDNITAALSWAQELKEGNRKDLPAPCSSGKCKCEAIMVPTAHQA